MIKRVEVASESYMEKAASRKRVRRCEEGKSMVNRKIGTEDVISSIF